MLFCVTSFGFVDMYDTALQLLAPLVLQDSRWTLSVQIRPCECARKFYCGHDSSIQSIAS